MAQLFSSFWIESINYYCEYNYNENLNEVTEISKQSLWYNSLIRIKAKPVFYIMFDSGIRTVDDIINNQGRMISYAALYETFSLASGFITYHGIISAIPAQLKKLLKENCLKIVYNSDGSFFICNINRVMVLSNTSKSLCIMSLTQEMR